MYETATRCMPQLLVSLCASFFVDTDCTNSPHHPLLGTTISELEQTSPTTRQHNGGLCKPQINPSLWS